MLRDIGGRFVNSSDNFIQREAVLLSKQAVILILLNVLDAATFTIFTWIGITMLDVG